MDIINQGAFLGAAPPKTGLSAPIALAAMDGGGIKQVRCADLRAFLPKAEMPSSKIGTRPIFEPIPLLSLARLKARSALHPPSGIRAANRSSLDVFSADC
ncbi:MAG: hypothetical protein LBD20_07740 [Spirochaetaceae bacterium]|nr:hypothetical protein [Spirochaetaceae bacterium]